MNRETLLIDISLNCTRTDWEDSDLAMNDIMDWTDEFMGRHEITNWQEVDFIVTLDTFVSQKIKEVK